MGIQIFDTDQPCSAAQLQAFTAQGGSAIGVYLNRGNPAEAKVIKPAGAQLFKQYGVRMFLIYEMMGKPVAPAAATADGQWCVEYCKSIGAPMDGSTFIARTMDYDAPESDMQAIKADFAAFGSAIAPAFQTWAYASGAVNAELFAAKLITGRWLTCSGGFRGTKEALATGAYEMRQSLPQEFDGLDTDPDTVHVANVAIGFIPFTPSPPIVPPAPAIAPGFFARLEHALAG